LTLFGLAWRLARRELRGGIGGFRIFLLCLAMGVAAIAAIGSIGAALKGSMRDDARIILGGDVEIRLNAVPASAAQLAWLRGQGRISHISQTRSMARTGAARALVELKAVDDAYPLFGSVVLSPGLALDRALARRGADWGAVVEPALLTRLNIAIGDTITLGKARFRIVATIVREPDRAARGIAFGLRVLVAHAALKASGLIQPGSLIRYHYRIALRVSAKAWRETLDTAFPKAGWRVRDTGNAAPGLGRIVDRISVFLAVVALTALLVGGVGVGNAARAFLQSRSGTIAILKCLGAPGRVIFAVYAIQITVLAAAGVAAGVTVGGLAPLAAGALFGGRLPIDPQFGVYPAPLALAAVFGILVTAAFSYWPLVRARAVSAATLFRDLIAPEFRWPGWRDSAVVAGLALLLGLLAVASAQDRQMALYFVAGTAVALIAFRLAAGGIAALSRIAPRAGNPYLRLALANLHRPGAPTATIATSLGMGLSVLIAVALVEGNLSRYVGGVLSESAPSLYFIDIQPDQVAAFDRLLAATPGLRNVGRVPMMHGRIVAIAGTPVDEIQPPANYAWILRGDRGLTWMRSPPATGSTVVEGEWWPSDYTGPPLLSFDAQAARALGIAIGDTITLNVLGREIETRVANLRRIDWNSLAINFVMILAPGVLDGAPQTHIATARADDAAGDAALERTVTGEFSNVSAIRVREILNRLRALIGQLATAVRLVSAVVVAAGILVLAGAIAASRKQRIYDAVMLKVLGATRRDVLAVFAIEFGLLGVVTVAIASGIGTLSAWAIVTKLMHADWVFMPATVALTALACLGVTVAIGAAGTWSALGQKAAPLLRNP
jgi:putative ABC transport system permease protein